MTSKVAINCSNLHVGGGLQVSASFIYELSRMPDEANKVTIIISSALRSILDGIKCDFTVFSGCHVIDVWGLKVGSLNKHFRRSNYSVVFTLFGPLYLLRPNFISIVGFAQPWIILPSSEAYHLLGFKEKIFSLIKFRMQEFFFRRADMIVVEADFVKDLIVKKCIADSGDIRVISNCISSIYSDSLLWEDIDIPNLDSDIVGGYVGRAYPHKNIKILPDIARALSDKYGIKMKFIVTLTDLEWLDLDSDSQKFFYNLGSVRPQQCPKIYSSVDVVILPSILECFSVSPLEAMAMSKPLFLSDRIFNRDVCKDFAKYFEPTNLEVIVSDLYSLYQGQYGISLEDAKRHALEFSSPIERAKRYLMVLDEANNVR